MSLRELHVKRSTVTPFWFAIKTLFVVSLPSKECRQVANQGLRSVYVCLRPMQEQL